MSKKDTPRGSTDPDAGVVPSQDFSADDAAETHVWKGSASGSSARRPPPVPGRPPMDPGPPSSVFFAADFEEELATLSRDRSTPRGSATPPSRAPDAAGLDAAAPPSASKPAPVEVSGVPSLASLPAPSSAALPRTPRLSGRPSAPPARSRSGAVVPGAASAPPRAPVAPEVPQEPPPSAAASEPTETMALADIELAIGGAPSTELAATAPARFAKATAQTLGRSFAGFRIVRKIAEGGMASVFLGRKAGPRGFNQHAAVKVVHPHFADQRAFVEMFLDEARIAALVQHANVCRVLDFGHAHGTYFLAMEYVHGEPWAELQQALFVHPEGAPVLPVIAAQVISLACEGLHAAHEAVDETGRPLHIVHRDVSPQNILVAFDGTVRVLDFGIASATDRLTTTRTGTVKGRLSYMAPEQMRADTVDARADVWSLGVVLREALEGRRLFRRQAEAATMLAVCSDPLPEWANHVPHGLRAVVDRALTRDRAQRYASARDMGVALSEFVRSQDTAISSADLSGWLERLFPERIETKRAWLTEPIPEPMPDNASALAAPVSEVASSPAEEGSPPALLPVAPEPGLPPPPAVSSAVDPPAPDQLASVSARPHRRGGVWLVVLLLLGGATWLAVDRYGAREEERARREAAARFLRETADAPEARRTADTGRDAPSEPHPAPAADSPAGAAEPASDQADDGDVAVTGTPQEDAPEADETVPEEVPDVRRGARRPPPGTSARDVEVPEAPVPAAEPGTLVVAFVGGWAEVYVGSTKLGTTPGRFELPSGPTRVVLKPFGAGPEIIRNVNVPAAGQRKLIVEP